MPWGSASSSSLVYEAALPGPVSTRVSWLLEAVSQGPSVLTDVQVLLPALAAQQGFLILSQGVTVSVPGLRIHLVLQSNLGTKDEGQRHPHLLNEDSSSQIRPQLCGISHAWPGSSGLCAEPGRASLFPAGCGVVGQDLPALSGQILGHLQMAALMPHFLPCWFRCCQGK